MAATREELIARDRAHSAPQLHQPQAEEKANDQAAADDQPLKAADKAEKIILPGPFTEKTEEDDIRRHVIPGFDQVIPHEVQDIILNQLYAEEEKKEEEKKDEEVVRSSKSPLYEYQHLSFFSKNAAQFKYCLRKAANDILDGSQVEVDRVVSLIKHNPVLLQYSTAGCDRLGRRVQGTLLQIAAMAGDVNIREITTPKEKKYRGIVELLQEVGQLSNEDVAKQLCPVLFSKDAIEANTARNERILAAVKHFGESIIQAKIAEPEVWSVVELRAAQKQCERAIYAFRTTLQETFNGVIAVGYVFDISILHQAMTWFEEKNNLDRFGGWRTLASDIFWINGIGFLQCIISARDTHVFQRGIAYDNLEVLNRSLKNVYGCTSFSLATSLLGHYFFLGCYGRVLGHATTLKHEYEGLSLAVKALISRKKESLAKLTQHPESRCVIQ